MKREEMLDTPLEKLPDVPRPIRKAAEVHGWKTLREIDRETLSKMRGVGRQMLFIFDGLVEMGTLRQTPKRGRPPKREDGYVSQPALFDAPPVPDKTDQRIAALEERAIKLADSALGTPYSRDALTAGRLASMFAKLAGDLTEIKFRRQVEKGLNGHA